MAERRNPEPAVLGQILLLQNSLEAAVDEQRLAEMVAATVAEVPGAGQVTVCIGGNSRAVSDGDKKTDSLPACPATPKNGGLAFPGCTETCPLSQNGNFRKFQLVTDQGTWGALFLKIKSDTEFSCYEPFVANTANSIAMHVENSRTATALERLNIDLDKRLRNSTNALERTEKDLRRRETQYQALFESSPIGIAHQKIIYDDAENAIDYLFLDANENYQELTGVDPRGRLVTEAFPGIEDDDFDWIGEFAKVAAEGGTVRCQRYLPANDRWYDVTAFQSSPGHFVAAFLEITEQKKYEEELEKARNYIANILDSMPSLLASVDNNGFVTQWNATARRTTEIDPEDAVGQPLDQLIPHLADQMERLNEAIRSQTEQSDPKHLRIEDGEQKFENITIYPLVGNNVEGAVIRVDDITERVCLEEMMIQSEKMMSVGGLAAGMAHEINNPLSGMMQSADVMKNRLTDLEIAANVRAAEKARIDMEQIKAFMQNRNIPRMLDRIKESGVRAATIVQNMLSFAQEGSGVRGWHNLTELIDRCVILSCVDYDLKKSYDFKQIEIVREYADDMPEVHCDADRVEQVIMNILRNGAEALKEKTAEEPEVWHPRFILRVFADRETGMAHMEIEDNGPGMDEETRKRIFEPFFTTKGPEQGTGLGLSVSYFIITENHAGDLSVQSDDGKGTAFTIKLPLGIAGVQDNTASNTAGKSILQKEQQR